MNENLKEWGLTRHTVRAYGKRVRVTVNNRKYYTKRYFPYRFNPQFVIDIIL